MIGRIAATCTAALINAPVLVAMAVVMTGRSWEINAWLARAQQPGLLIGLMALVLAWGLISFVMFDLPGVINEQ